MAPLAKNGNRQTDAPYIQDHEAWRKEHEKEWVESAPKPGPYLAHIKALSAAWPSLRFLANFMDVGTTPTRWRAEFPGGLPPNLRLREQERSERMRRTNVSVLDYPLNGTKIQLREFHQAENLRCYLSEIDEFQGHNEDLTLRLFVVEDLSREVIEALGSHFDIDPMFFRAHVEDSVWHNVNDWWREPPNLDMVKRRQNWFQVRFIRQRYFRDSTDFNQGEAETSSFNIYRPFRQDFSESAFWDQGHGRVAWSRAKATIWMKYHIRDSADSAKTIAILLLDPSAASGSPLWREQNNWASTPSLRTHVLSNVEGPSELNGNLAKTFVYWAQRPDAFHWFKQHRKPDQDCSPICLPLQVLLHIVCDEWLTVTDYINARLEQIDMGLEFPIRFANKENESIQESLRRLHHWRRVVPVYRKRVSETISRINRGPNAEEAGPMDSMFGPYWTMKDCLDTDCVQSYKREFQLILKLLEEKQEKLEHLIGGALGIINVAEAMKSYSDNKHLHYLTWVATIFIPLNFVATMLSMATDPFQLGQSAQLWAEVALPTGLLTVVLVALLRYPRQVKGFLRDGYRKAKGWVAFKTDALRGRENAKELC